MLAAAGTHGKTTTSSLLAWILEHAGLAPGFLIGGVPLDFGVSARLGTGRHFVIEADEYDTAFFDKRAKFVHYRPRTAILNNLEHDHARHLSGRRVDTAPVPPAAAHGARQRTPDRQRGRTEPAAGARDGLLDTDRAFQRGGCIGTRAIGGSPRRAPEILPRSMSGTASAASVAVDWDVPGRHNAANALAALAAAYHAGVPVDAAIEALRRFRGVKRRLEVRGVVGGITVYDDFAHHPTAITTTLDGVRQRARKGGRVIAVLEPRSNTMKLGTHKTALAHSLTGADRVYVYQSPEVTWDVADAMAPLGKLATVQSDLPLLVAALTAEARPGDHLVLMSNGSFGGLHERLLASLRTRNEQHADAGGA